MMRPSQRLFTLLFTFVFLLAVAAPAFAQDATATVNTGALNIRSGPSLAYGSVSTIPYGFGVRLIARNSASDWVLIGLTNGVQGWVNINYLYTTYPVQNLPVNDAAPASNIVPTAVVENVSVLNVRVNPDPNSAVVVTIGRGTGMQLLGRNYNSTWAQVRLGDGRTGWVAAYAIVATVPVRSLGLTDGSVYTPPIPASQQWQPTTGGGTSSGATYYTVAPGDTLAGIAAVYGVNLYTLASANGIYNVNYIYAGQRLWIP